MTVTRKINNMGIKVPVLHRVVYHRHPDGIQSEYYRSYRDYQIDEWLKENCKHNYYHSPGYLREKSIQFECSDEALLFALRWS